MIYFAGSKSVSVHPSIQPGYDDNYWSQSYGFVERQNFTKHYFALIIQTNDQLNKTKTGDQLISRQEVSIIEIEQFKEEFAEYVDIN